MLQADTAYLKVDYTGVIDELEGVAPSSLPTTQKYELATSYLQGLNFSEDQKKVILNNVTLKSDSLYLHYWIYIGRHDFTQALDTAKRIDDSDLIIYALRKEIKATRDSEKLSGEQREKNSLSLRANTRNTGMLALNSWKQRQMKPKLPLAAQQQLHLQKAPQQKARLLQLQARLSLATTRSSL